MFLVIVSSIFVVPFQLHNDLDIFFIYLIEDIVIDNCYNPIPSSREVEYSMTPLINNTPLLIFLIMDLV